MGKLWSRIALLLIGFFSVLFVVGGALNVDLFSI